MQEHPLKTLEKIDPKLMGIVEEAKQLAFSDGALPKKYKFLIAIALDATHGAIDAVKPIAQVAMEAGATKEEIADALRVALYVNGARSAYTAAVALGELV
jgi:alkylhydroperoxidase/carboxymuconolactone decarboxylase family protein YurZ